MCAKKKSCLHPQLLPPPPHLCFGVLVRKKWFLQEGFLQECFWKNVFGRMSLQDSGSPKKISRVRKKESKKHTLKSSVCQKFISSCKTQNFSVRFAKIKFGNWLVGNLAIGNCCSVINIFIKIYKNDSYITQVT